jgi:hypothetical protein
MNQGYISICPDNLKMALTDGVPFSLNYHQLTFKIFKRSKLTQKAKGGNFTSYQGLPGSNWL